MRAMFMALTIGVFLLGGCGPYSTPWGRAKRDWLKLEREQRVEAAKEAYVECLRSKDDVSECEGLRKAFEAEVEAYKTYYPASPTIPVEIQEE